MHNNRHQRFKKPPRPADNYVPPYAADVLNRPIADLKVRDDTMSLLTGAGYVTLLDVLKKEEKDFYRISTFNKKNLFDVLNALRLLNLKLKPTTPPPSPQGQPQARRDERTNAHPQNNNNNGQRPQSGQQSAFRTPNLQNPQNIHDRNDNRKVLTFDNRNQRREADVTPESFYTVKPNKGPRPVYVAPKDEPDAYLKVNKGGKWGFSDRSGKLVVAPIYDEVFSFKENMCCVEKDELFGFINREGQEVIAPQYTCAASFSDGYACVFKVDKCGYINKENETVIDFKFEAGTPVTNGECRVKKDGKWGELHLDDVNNIRWIN